MKATLALLGLPFVLAFATAQAADLQPAEAAFAAGRYDEALPLFQAALADPAKAAQAHHYLGRIALRQGDAEKAQDEFESAIKIDGNNPEYHFQLGSALCNQAQSANMFSALGLAKDCVAEFEKAVDLAPDNLDYRQGLFEFYLGAPGIAGGGEDKAAATAEAIGTRDPALGLALKAKIAAHDEDFAKAETLLKDALAKAEAKDQPAYRLQLGLMYQQAERYADARNEFSALTRQKPDAYAAYYQLGRTAVLAKTELDAGAEALRTYLKAPEDGERPSHAWAHFRLGQLYLLMGKKDEGKAELAQAALDQDDQRLRKELGKIKLR